MKKLWSKTADLILLTVSSAISGDPANTLTPEEKREGFMLLFNGRDLTGWDGAPGFWSVRDGAIVGSTEGHPLAHNTFLIHKGEYANFVLRSEIRLRNHNSGIQFRSRRHPDWVVTGLQADASEAGPDKSAWGNLYDEKGKGRNLMRTPDEGWLKSKSVVRHRDWNQYEITASGRLVVLKLNGVETIRQEVDAMQAGVIAIQAHMGESMEVRVRNIRIKVLR
jgi:hypothetical protein